MAAQKFEKQKKARTTFLVVYPSFAWLVFYNVHVWFDSNISNHLPSNSRDAILKVLNGS